MLTKAQNDLLTQTDAGTPMGELFRRYWIPVLLSEQLPAPDCAPVQVRILGEDLVAFRDTTGRIGLLAEHCSHRGTSLYYGFSEGECLRCPYHGWLYDPSGKCMEQPFEPAQSLMKHTLKHPAYPVQELGGLLFTYMGPPAKQPLLPRWDILVWRHGRHRIERPETLNCNWLQALENTADFVHTYFLHAHTLKRMGKPHMAAGYLGRPFANYGFQPCEWGLIKSWDYEGENAGGGWGNLVMLPTMLRQSDIFSSMHWRTPVDDTHTEIFIAYYDPDPEGCEIDEPPTLQYAPPQVGPDGEYLMDSFFSQDKMAWETQGPVFNRSQERLGYSDRGIVMVREMIHEQIEKVQRGEDPLGLVWDPAQNVCIELEVMTSERDRRGGATPRGVELPHTLPREQVFDDRHERFEIPYGAARPRPAAN
jgi:5,5'-dehydrodivanillate O-demethylase oxygenase subunit